MDRLSLFLKKNTFITYGTPNLMRRRHRKKLGQRRPWWSGGWRGVGAWNWESLYSVRRGGVGAQPPGFRSSGLGQVRLQREDAHLFMLRCWSRRSRRWRGADAVGCDSTESEGEEQWKTNSAFMVPLDFTMSTKFMIRMQPQTITGT